MNDEALELTAKIKEALNGVVPDNFFYTLLGPWVGDHIEWKLTVGYREGMGLTPMEKRYLDKAVRNKHVKAEWLNGKVRMDGRTWTVVGWHKTSRKYPIILKAELGHSYGQLKPEQLALLVEKGGIVLKEDD